MDGKTNKVKLSGGIWFIFLVLISYCVFTQYPLLTLFGIVTLAFIIRSIWGLYQPAVLLFWFLYQWVQVMGSIWFADLYQASLNRMFASASAEIAVYLCFTGIILQVVFARLLLKRQKIYSFEELKAAADKININRLIKLYLISAVIFPFAYRFAISVEQLTQIILLISKVKQIFLVLLVFLMFLRGEKKSIILLILLFEFLAGFLTYFSTFKDVIIICLICYISFVREVKLMTVLKVLPVVAGLFILMVFWSSVKGKYRTFVNEGTRVQQVQVDNSDAFKKIWELALNFKASDFQQGLRNLAYRVQYTMFISIAMDRVPDIMPHENGKLLLDASRFVLVPRAIDPDKGVHDASLKTSKYTGLRIAGISKGTSMAIGYFGDAYIDFGPFGMMPEVIIIAMLVTAYYVFLMTRKLNILMGYSIATAFIMNLGFFESDMVIILGNLKNGFIINLVLVATLYGWINRYITTSAPDARKKKISHLHLSR